MADVLISAAEALGYNPSIVISEYAPTVPYMDRVLPWGETCREVESRLKRAGLREAWRQRAIQIRKDRRITNHDAWYVAMCEFKEALEINEPELSANDKVFLEKCREGLMLDLPSKASVERELDWVSANLHRSYPNVQRAPSLAAINFIIDARTDARVRATFWNTFWSKRMSPGDRKAVSPFAGDKEGEHTAASVRDEDLLRAMKERLGES